MQDINLVIISLIILLILFLNINEQFITCKNKWIITPPNNGCCPVPSNNNDTWENINGTCCRSKISEKEYQSNKDKKYKKYKKITDNNSSKKINYYCKETITG